KGERVLKMLLAMRDDRIASVMARYGFTPDVIREGFQLLEQLAGRRGQIPRHAPPADPKLLDRLDAWENKWLPIAEASLGRHHPEVKEQVFLNISRESGRSVYITVRLFTDRVIALASGTPAEKAARALLAERGLCEEMVGEATQILHKLGEIEEPAPLPTLDPEEIAAAEKALWAY